jgi:hypothetical protein
MDVDDIRVGQFGNLGRTKEGLIEVHIALCQLL